MAARTIIGNYVDSTNTLALLVFSSDQFFATMNDDAPTGAMGAQGTGGQDGNVDVENNWVSHPPDDYTSIWHRFGDFTLGVDLFGNAWKRHKLEFTYESGMQISLLYSQGIYNVDGTTTANGNFQGIAFVPVANTDGTWFNDPAKLASHFLQFGGDDDIGTMPNPYHRAFPSVTTVFSSVATNTYVVPLIEGDPFVVGTKYNLVFVQDMDDGFAWAEPNALQGTFFKDVKISMRIEKSGLFISKPGVDIEGGADPGDMLFDSSAPDFMQVLRKSDTPITIPTATIGDDGTVTPYIKIIETDVKVPFEEENATVLVRWNSLTSTSNLHPTAYPDDWNVPSTDNYAVVPPYLNLDHLNLSNPANTGITHGYSLTARTLKSSTKIIPQTPVSLSTVGTDGRAEPIVDNGRGGHESNNILWSNTSHIFMTDSEGAMVATYVSPSDGKINNHSPSWKVVGQAGLITALPIVWSGAEAAAPDDIFIYSKNLPGGTITKRSTKHTNLHPNFSRLSSGVDAANKILYVKSGYNQIIQNQFLQTVEDDAIITHRPNKLANAIYNSITEPTHTLWSAGADETISDVRNGPSTGGEAVEGGEAWRSYAIAFVVKGIADDSLGRIMIIDDVTAPNQYSPLGIVPRQVSPSYLNCSSPAWSPEGAAGPGPEGSKLLFIADAGTPERRVCIVDSGTYWGTDDSALPNGPIHNPYSLVELTETKANTATWANNTHILSDYNGGSYTDVSTLTPASDTVDIVFTNGSPYKEHLVAWTLYRVKGV
jgi:hypothetical protein